MENQVNKMKTTLIVTLMMFLLGLFFIAPTHGLASENGLKYTIAVSKFNNKSNWRGEWNLGDAWSAVLTDSLNQTGRFIVLGEKDMRREAMAEQDFAASGRAAGGGYVGGSDGQSRTGSVQQHHRWRMDAALPRAKSSGGTLSSNG